MKSIRSGKFKKSVVQRAKKVLEHIGLKEKVQISLSPLYSEYFRMVGYNNAFSDLSLNPMHRKSYNKKRFKSKFKDVGLDTQAINCNEGGRFIIVVFRENIEEFKYVLQNLYDLQRNCCNSIILMYCPARDEEEKERVLFAGATPVESPSNMMSDVEHHLSISSAEWVIFNFTDSQLLTSMLEQMQKVVTHSKQIVHFRTELHLHQDFSVRHPERLMNFAVRRSLVQELLKESALSHPFLLLSACLISLNNSVSDRISVSYMSAESKQDNTFFRFSPLNRTPFFDKLAIRVFAEVLARMNPGFFSHMLANVPYWKKTLHLSSSKEEGISSWKELIPDTTDFDVVYITDFRIRGGGLNSLLNELEIAKSEGLRVAVWHLEAITYLCKDWTFKQEIIEQLARLKVPIINGLSGFTAELVVLRYPPILVGLPDYRPLIKAKNAVVVINQPPRRMHDDADFYQPLNCHQNACQLLGVEPVWAPNGPDAREAMQKEKEHIPFLNEDWLNVVSCLASDQEILQRVERIAQKGRSVTIGRHTRDVFNKWPSAPSTLLQCYPDSEHFQVVFLGGCGKARSILGYVPKNWTTLPYGSMDVAKFLTGLDVFVFFPNERRIEPMARCVVEAMGAGVPVVLPTCFQGMYGDTPIYCEPIEVIERISDLVRDSAIYKAKCFEVREEARHLFGKTAYIERLKRFGVDLGVRQVSQEVSFDKEHTDFLGRVKCG